MNILVYDGSFAGLLTCVFEIYERRLGQVSVVSEKHFQPQVFGETFIIITDENKTRRVWTSLGKLVTSSCLKKIYNCYLSEYPDIGDVITGFIRLAFDTQESPEYAYATALALRISQVDKMVHREKHRMEAFIRFRLTKDGIYYAVIEPDFNVIPLIVKHFKNRYADQRWLICDINRNYGIYYDLSDVSEVNLTFESGNDRSDIFSEDEIKYQALWSDYFTHVNISERNNKKLHLMHVPKRYWKHLSEKTFPFS